MNFVDIGMSTLASLYAIKWKHSVTSLTFPQNRRGRSTGNEPDITIPRALHKDLQEKVEDVPLILSDLFLVVDGTDGSEI